MNKKIAFNSIYNTIYKGFNALFPLLISAYVSRVLLAEGVGKVTYANTIATYFATLAALGLPSYGIKEIARYKDDEKNKNKTFIELFIINAISTIFFCFAYYFMVNNFSYFSNRSTLFNVMGLMVILNIFNIDWFYQGIEEYGFIAIRSIVIKIISFFLLILFVHNPNDYIKYGFILCIAMAGNYLLNIVCVNRYMPIKWSGGIEIKHHIKPILILLSSTIATEIYTMLDTVMIEYFFNENYVAYYSYSVKIVRTVYTVTVAMIATFYPQISYFFNHKQYDDASDLINKGIKVILLISVPCFIGIFSVADCLVPVLFGNSFLPSILSMKILSPLVVVFSFAYFLGHIVLMANGKEKVILFSTIVGACINFICNIIMIPLYAHYGASIASLVAEIIVTIIVVVYGMKYYKLKLKISFIRSILFSYFILILIMFFTLFLNLSVFLNLVIKVLLGVTGYLLALYISKNEVFINVITTIRKREN